MKCWTGLLTGCAIALAVAVLALRPNAQPQPIVRGSCIPLIMSRQLKEGDTVSIDTTELGLTKLLNADGRELSNATIEAGHVYEFCYDGDAFRLRGEIKP